MYKRISSYLIASITIGALSISLSCCKRDEAPDPQMVSISASQLSVKEGSEITISGSVPNALAAPVQLNLKLTGNAVYGETKDYVTTPAATGGVDVSFTIPANTTTFTIFVLKALADSEFEALETVTVSVVGDKNVVPGLSGTLDIKIEDGPSIGFSSATLSIKEGQQFIQLPVNVTGTWPENATVNFQLVASAAFDISKDVTLVGVTVTNNVATATLPLAISLHAQLDAQVEPNDKLTMTILPKAGIGISLGTIEITVADNNLGNALAAEYLFNGSADDTGPNAKHGVPDGAIPTSGRSDRPSTAYQFDGASRIIAPFNPAINFARDAEFAVGVWVKVAATQNDMSGTINDIVRAWTGDAQGYPFGISYFNNSHPTTKNTFIAARYDGAICANVPQVVSDATDNQFHHVVLVRKNSQLLLYVDGLLARQSADFTACETTNINNLYIGCRGQNLRCFTGVIDDLRIFNRALTDAEVLELKSL